MLKHLAFSSPQASRDKNEESGDNTRLAELAATLNLSPEEVFSELERLIPLEIKLTECRVFGSCESPTYRICASARYSFGEVANMSSESYSSLEELMAEFKTRLEVIEWICSQEGFLQVLRTTVMLEDWTQDQNPDGIQEFDMSRLNLIMAGPPPSVPLRIAIASDLIGSIEFHGFPEDDSIKEVIHLNMDQISFPEDQDLNEGLDSDYWDDDDDDMQFNTRKFTH